MERHYCDHCRTEFRTADELARHRRELPGAKQIQTEFVPDPRASAPTGRELTPHSGTRPPDGTGGITAP
jgi:hypothetical protein